MRKKIKEAYHFKQRGFTLLEALIAVVILSITISAAIYGYLESSRVAEFSSYSLAANNLAMQKIEQTRACKWDTQASPAVDELVPSNFPAEIELLDVPVVGTNATFATNFTTITEVSKNPPLKLIRADCVWALMQDGQLYTNSFHVYRSPDQ